MKNKFSEGLFDPQNVADKLNIQKGYHILDAGCGTGYMTKVFAQKCGIEGIVWAVDNDFSFSHHKIRLEQTPGVTALAADITRPLPIPTSTVDVVFLCGVFHIFSSNQKNNFIAETQRILRENGVLALVCLSKKERYFGPPPDQLSSPDELKDEIPMLPGMYFEIEEHMFMQLFIHTTHDSNLIADKKSIKGRKND
jgi:ubiquinone/menaquinone biosynthesis C-methylase UbiE